MTLRLWTAWSRARGAEAGGGLGGDRPGRARCGSAMRAAVAGAALTSLGVRPVGMYGTAELTDQRPAQVSW